MILRHCCLQFLSVSIRISCTVRDTSLYIAILYLHLVWLPSSGQNKYFRFQKLVPKKWLAPLIKCNRGSFHTWVTPAGLIQSHQAASDSLLLQAKPFFALWHDYYYSQSHLIVFISEQWDPGFTSLGWTWWVDWIEMSADSFIKRHVASTDGAQTWEGSRGMAVYLSICIYLYIYIYACMFLCVVQKWFCGTLFKYLKMYTSPTHIAIKNQFTHMRLHSLLVHAHCFVLFFHSVPFNQTHHPPQLTPICQSHTEHNETKLLRRQNNVATNRI